MTGEAIEGAEIKTYDEKSKDGYEFVSDTAPLKISTNEDENIISVYYEPVSNLSYRVEYYYDGELDANKTETYTNIKFGTEIDVFLNKVIDGYRLDRVENLTLVVGTNTDENVIKVYYVKRTDITYTVYYLENDTANELHEEKTVTGNTYQSTVQEEAITISGYYLSSGSPAQITIQANDADNIITFYYEKRTDLSYTIKYKEYGTDIEISTDETIYDQTYLDEVSVSAKGITGYELVSDKTIRITIGANSEDNIVTFYYKKISGITYRVEYYYDNVLDKENTYYGIATFGDVISEYPEELKDGYEFYSDSGEIIISVNEENNVIKVYYIRKTATVNENKLEKTATALIEEEDEQIEYTITYTIKLEEFLGEATITIEDELPYSIEKITYAEGSEGTYISEDNKVKWVETVNINTYENSSSKEIVITKTFYVVYDKDEIDYSKTEIVNTATANILFDNSVESQVSNKATATTNTNFTTAVTVTKIWQDENNITGNRPESITLVVKNGSSIVASEVVTADDETADNIWQCQFTDLQKYDENGNEIQYEADEQIDSGYYTKTVDGLIVTNTLSNNVSTVIVKYVDKNNPENTITDSYTIYGVEGEKFDISDKVYTEISDYVLVDAPENTSGTFTEESQVITIYYAKKTSVVIKYLDKNNTTETLADEVTLDGYVGKEYDTKEYEESFEGYTLVGNSGNTSGEMTENQIEVTYYYAKNTSVKINYVGTDGSDLGSDEISGYVGKEYNTKEYEKSFEGYTLIRNSGNTSGEMTENQIEVTYYYAKNTSVLVRYVKLNGDSESVIKEITIDGYVGKEYDTEELTFTNYECVDKTDNLDGFMTADQIVVTYYYKQKATIIVQHIDRETNNILYTETLQGYVGDKVYVQAMDIANYVVVQEPENTTIVYAEEEQIIQYYYAHISQGVVEKHIDYITNKIIEEELHTGNEGDPYSISSKEIEGYDLVEVNSNGDSLLPTNSSGKMSKDELIEVRYYYIKKAKVIIEYYDLTDGEKIIDDETIDGHEDDTYEVTAKDFEGYNLVSDSGNTKGEMTVIVNDDGSFDIETHVIFYYKQASGGVTVNYIDYTTGDSLGFDEYEGNVGDPYSISAKTIDGYDLMEVDEDGNNLLPENSSGEMTKEQIIIDYYYIKRSKVIVEYIDELTNEIIATEEITGDVGDSYQTSGKSFDGYDLVQSPTNDSGVMTSEDITVKYYYSRKAEVVIKYIEKSTGYEISGSYTINGHVGDSYEVDKKEFEYYTFIETSGNDKGTMTQDGIEVILYYQRKEFNLSIANWVDKIEMNGISTNEKDYSTKDEITKVDMNRKKVSSASIKVTFKIRISNTGEIEGTVGKLIDTLPSGYSFYQEDNTINWTNVNGSLITTDLKDTIIKPGEYIEIELVLRWNGGEDNLGSSTNTITIAETSNSAGFADAIEADNQDSATIVLSVSTGLDRNDRIILLRTLQGLVAVLIVLIIAKRKIKRKRKNERKEKKR